MDELPLQAPPDILNALVALLPPSPDPVLVQEAGSVTCSYVRSIVENLLAEALAKGYCIDRSNGDGPMDEWNGWLVVHGEKVKTFIKTTHAKNLA